MPEQYNFITHWQTTASLQQVWDAIYRSEEWPLWWKGVVSVEELHPGDEMGIGSIREYKLRSPMLYTLSFHMLVTHREDMKRIKANASGELQGTGEWTFKRNGDITDIKCLWNVSTTVKWMNWFAPILAPIFKYNHSKVMKWGAESLSQKLNSPVVSIS